MLDTEDSSGEETVFVLMKLILCYALDSARYRDEGTWDLFLGSCGLDRNRKNIIHLDKLLQLGFVQRAVGDK